MAGQALMPVPMGGGTVGAPRYVPPLPPGIPILPGQLKAAKRRLPLGLIVVLVLVGLVGLIWFDVYYHDYDGKRIDPVVTRAVLARAPKGTQLPVTLWSGPRILQIRSAFPTGGRNTMVVCDVIDPKTGAKDPKYAHGADTLIEGVAVTIH